MFRRSRKLRTTHSIVRAEGGFLLNQCFLNHIKMISIERSIYNSRYGNYFYTYSTFQAFTFHNIAFTLLLFCVNTGGPTASLVQCVSYKIHCGKYSAWNSRGIIYSYIIPRNYLLGHIAKRAIFHSMLITKSNFRKEVRGHNSLLFTMSELYK